MKNLAQAILKVMDEVKGIDKTMNVGTGNSSYKGVSDKEVKKIIGSAMQKNGLCLLPIGVNASTKVDRWMENGQYGEKSKQSVFTEVTTKYLLLHESGESQVLEGYGQGVDSQDKSAGKATTYALKYVMLYTFLTPTGTIDDADNTHSDTIPAPIIVNPIIAKIKDAIAKLSNCNSLDELTMFKDTLDLEIVTSKEFKAAAIKKYNEVKEK